MAIGRGRGIGGRSAAFGALLAHLFLAGLAPVAECLHSHDAPGVEWHTDAPHEHAGQHAAECSLASGHLSAGMVVQAGPGIDGGPALHALEALLTDQPPRSVRRSAVPARGPPHV